MSQRVLLAATFLVVSAGFLLGLWPLAAAGVVAMACVGRGWFALPVGFLLDIAYGAPIGALERLFFPFTILALAVVVVRFWTRRYFLDRSSTDRLD